MRNSSPLIFKDANGDYRWVSISSSAYEDRDREIVSHKALSEDVKKKNTDREYGPLLWWHIPGVVLGTCDYNAMCGRFLVESGVFSDAFIGERFARHQQDALREQALGVSIAFEHLPYEPSDDGVFTWINRVERSLLPHRKAANPFTTLIVKETRMTQEQEQEMLNVIGDDPAGRMVLERIKNALVTAEKSAAGIRHKAAGGDGASDAETDPPEDEVTELTDTEKRLVDAITTAVTEKVTQVVSEAMAGLAVTQKATTIDDLLELQSQAQSALERLQKVAGIGGAPTWVRVSDASRAADAMLRSSTSKATLVSDAPVAQKRATPLDTIGDLLWNSGNGGK